ncbi:hypothetical protein ID866_9768 [Astraeus odoratus]|nr:hypothetical protein ID866_9768 [Astraeus odoratus]
MVRTTRLLTAPELGTVVRPIHVYSDEQNTQIKELRLYAQSLVLPESDPYYKWELRWLNKPDTIPRYMRAAKWKMHDAQKRIKGTMEWRREFKPDLIPPDEVKIESETGKIILNGYDKDGRPIIYMRPGRENTETSPRQLRHLVWWLERAKDMMPPGQETLVIFVDYKTATLRTNPSVSVAAKMRFNPNLADLVPQSQLDSEFGGEFEFEFDHDVYWKQVVEHCGIAPDGTRLPGHFDSPIVPENGMVPTTTYVGF